MFKRCFDIGVSLVGLALLLPVIIFIGGLIACLHGGPIFFRQSRPGRDGKPFRMNKFRTMTSRRDDGGVLLPDENRLTRLGRFLRSTSLDELPEFWNVLKGDMSLVGPRPLLMDYLPLYDSRQARRHEVRPGITGWAQVNGRNDVNWPERLEMDIWYIENQSFWLDIKILLMTVWNVVARRGITAEGHATCHPFRGNDRLPSP